MTKDKPKKSLIYSIVASAFLLILVGSAAYAYVGQSVILDNSTITLDTSHTGYYFYVDGGNETVIDLKKEFFEKDVVALTPVYKSDTSRMRVYLERDYSYEQIDDLACEYDIYWEWTSEHQYSTPSVELGTQVRYCSSTGSYISTDEKYYDPLDCNSLSTINSEFMVSIASSDGTKEMEMSRIENVDGRLLLLHDSLNSSSKYYNFTFTFYNLPVDQTDYIGKAMSGKFVVDNVSCRAPNFGESIANGENLVEGITSMEGLELEDAMLDSWSVVNEDGYRFEGPDPLNYICFDTSCSDGRYRIIGAFDEVSHGVANSYLVKVVKDEPLSTKMPWSSTANIPYYYSDWSTSTLNSYLNTTYYSSLSSSAVGMIQTVTWNFGSIQSGTASDYYTAENDPTLTYDDSVYGAVEGNISLFAVSDIGYAVLEKDCGRELLLSSYGNKTNLNIYSCLWMNWMYNSPDTHWVLTPYSNTNAHVLYSYGISRSYGTNSNYIRPTFYLKNDVYVVSGIGSYSNPYIVSRNESEE